MPGTETARSEPQFCDDFATRLGWRNDHGTRNACPYGAAVDSPRLPPLIAVITAQGFIYGLGNRELGGEALPEWGKRAERAHLNLLANLPAFAALVLVAGLAGVSNEVTEIGAQQFFWARVAHAVIYIAGIPYIRAIAFGVSLGGLFAIAGELLSAWSVTA